MVIARDYTHLKTLSTRITKTLEHKQQFIHNNQRFNCEIQNTDVKLEKKNITTYSKFGKQYD